MENIPFKQYKIIFMVFLFLNIFIPNADAANGDLVWTKNITHSSGVAYPYAVINDSSGIYLAGVANNACAGGWYFGHGGRWYVEKRNIDGSQAWQKADNFTSTSDCAHEIDLDDTGVYVTGSTNSGAGLAGGTKWRVEKRSKANGIVIWSQTVGEIHGGGSTGNGTIVNDTDVFSVGQYFSGNGYIRTVRINKGNGQIVWTHNTPLGMGSSPTAIAADSTGVYISGTYGVTWGDGDWVIEKLALSNGQRVWIRQPNYGSSINSAKIVAIDSSGLYVVEWSIFGGTPRIEKWPLSGGPPIWTKSTTPTPIPEKSHSPLVYTGSSQIIETYGNGSWTSPELFVAARNTSNGNISWSSPVPWPSSAVSYVFIKGSSAIYGVKRDGTSNASLQERSVTNGSLAWEKPSVLPYSYPVGIEGSDEFIYLYKTIYSSASVASAVLEKRELKNVPPPPPPPPSPPLPNLTSSAVSFNSPTPVIGDSVVFSAQINNIGSTQAVSTAAGSMTTYYGTGANPFDIAFDGVNMWTSNGNANSVTKVSPSGTMTTFTGTGAGPRGIAFDGVNMWTANTDHNSVTKISPTGSMTTFTGTGGGPWGIAFDGTNMWTANIATYTVTRVTPSGTMTTYSLPGSATPPWGITFDGTNMWTANWNANTATKISPTGAMTTYNNIGAIPRALSFDGTNMWTANGNNVIGGSISKILAPGSVVSYPLTRVPTDIAFDGVNMWMSNYSNSSVAKVTPAGVETIYTGTGAGPYSIAFDGTNMWTVNNNDNSVTKIGVGAGFSNFFQLANGAAGSGVVTDLPPSSMTSLATGASASISFTHSFAGPGTFSVRACADMTSYNTGGKITESNEIDNCGPWTDITVSNPSPTATISGTGCTIPEGASTCNNGRVTWQINYATSPNVYNFDTGSTYSVNSSGNNLAVLLKKGPNKIQARNISAELASVTLIADCDTAINFWDGTKCAPVPIIKIEANPNIIRAGKTAEVQLEITSTSDLNCVLYGAHRNTSSSVPDSFVHMGTVSPVKSYPSTTLQLESDQIVTISCTVAGLTITEEARVMVIGLTEEI